jgi:hypothetical protein
MSAEARRRRIKHDGCIVIDSRLTIGFKGVVVMVIAVSTTESPQGASQGTEPVGGAAEGCT